MSEIQRPDKKQSGLYFRIGAEDDRDKISLSKFPQSPMEWDRSQRRRKSYLEQKLRRIMDKIEQKILNKEIILYFLLNAGLVNVFWWFAFMFGTHITSHQANFFNNVLAPIIYNLYTLCIVSAVPLFLIGYIMVKFNNVVGKKMLFYAVWLTIISPLFESGYYLLLFLYKMADIPNLIVIPMSMGIAYFNFVRGRKFIIG